MQTTKIEFGFCLLLACAILLLPLKLVIAWIFAVAVHETFHYLALRMCRVQIRGLRITARGVIMETEPLDGFKGFFCALAGPIGGFLLIFLRRQMPYAAICGFLQSCYNLIPIQPQDGGRALHYLLLRVKERKPKKISLQTIKTNSTIAQTKKPGEM